MLSVDCGMAALVSPLHLWRGAGGEENSFASRKYSICVNTASKSFNSSFLILRTFIPNSLSNLPPSPLSTCGEGPGERKILRFQEIFNLLQHGFQIFQLFISNS